MSRKRSRHSDYGKFILLALLKNGPPSLYDLKKLTLILVAQFEIVGMEFGSKVVSGLLSMLARPAAVRSSKQRAVAAGRSVDDHIPQFGAYAGSLNAFYQLFQRHCGCRQQRGCRGPAACRLCGSGDGLLAQALHA